MTGMNKDDEARQPGPPGIVLSSNGLGGSSPERTCEQGCNGCEECTDYENDDEH